jgi:Cdc6-like AAA superfamily ATPase
MESPAPTAQQAAPRDEQVAKLLALLAEAARAGPETVGRFVSPRPGILEEASARRHQLVHGRRGVGKSTLLRRVAAGDSKADREVIFIDVETLRGRPYPDVLIELLSRFLKDLESRLRRGGFVVRLKRRRLLRRVQRLSDFMDRLLKEPQTAEHTVKELRSESRRTIRRLGGSGRIKMAIPHKAGTGSGSVDASMARESDKGNKTEAASEARYERTKMDGLSEASILISDILGAAHDELKVPTLVVLDDFYHIRLADQPEVLAYLHQVVKELDIYLKICGVKHRLNPYEDGDPPVGMQPDHDADQFALEATLERFDSTKGFLEKVLAGITEKVNLDLDVLITDGGRERLVLASGGVARDYLSAVRGALRNATERPASGTRIRNKITAEDVARAASALYEQKQEELKKDAGEEAEALRLRLSEIIDFAVETNRTNVLLVEATKLQEEAWGKQIQGLVDLRLLHKVETLSTKRGGETYAGRKFTAFTLDLAAWTSTRSERIAPMDFWKTSEKQKMRQEKLIYTPELAAEAKSRGKDSSIAEKAPESKPALEIGEQLTLDDTGLAEEAGDSNW